MGRWWGYKRLKKSLELRVVSFQLLRKRVGQKKQHIPIRSANRDVVFEDGVGYARGGMKKQSVQVHLSGTHANNEHPCGLCGRPMTGSDPAHNECVNIVSTDDAAFNDISNNGISSSN